MDCMLYIVHYVRVSISIYIYIYIFLIGIYVFVIVSLIYGSRYWNLRIEESKILTNELLCNGDSRLEIGLRVWIWMEIWMEM